ncbi:MAG: cold shock domain-containing protein, partial [Bacteroidota bacterium]
QRAQIVQPRESRELSSESPESPTQRAQRAQPRDPRKLRKEEGIGGNDIMYMDEMGNFTTVPPHLQERTENKLEDIQISVPKKEEREAVETIRNGRVKFFNTEKGYGFIIDDETGESYFAHANNLIDEITDNDKVTFEIGSGPKGPIAMDVKLK